jgi:hypothetical protein
MRLPLLAAIACLLCFAAPPAPAGDASVEARLDARGIKYEIDADGDYKVVVSYEKEQRTQLVFVSGATESIKGLTVREVFSPAGKVNEDAIAGKALALLTESRTKKIGAWEIAGDVLYYVIKLPDSADAAQLDAAIDIVAEIADDKEIELSGDKDAL